MAADLSCSSASGLFFGTVVILCLSFEQLIAQGKYSERDNSSNTAVHDFASIILQKLPKNALVLTKGDLPTNTMR